MGEKQGHTPGPWTFEADVIEGDWIITTNHEFEDARSVVEVCNADEADIRLIAAGPDLLAAAIHARMCVPFPSDAHAKLDAAIRRATGEDSPANSQNQEHRS